MTIRKKEIERVIAEGAKRVLARASDSYLLSSEVLVPRIRATVEKYVVRYNPDAPAREVSAFIEELQVDDLCLIVACEQGNENAWNDLVERFSATVRSAARSASSNEESAEDLAQSIWAELHGLRERTDGKPAGKLSYYSGRGSLAGWLRAVVAQLAVDQHRKQSRLLQAEEDGDFDRLTMESATRAATAGVYLEQMISNKLAGLGMQKALKHALNELSVEERLIIKLYYFDDLKLRQVGVVLGVHEATVSRRLTKIHSDLRKRVEATLVEQGWKRAEIERGFEEVGLHLQTDVEALVTDRAQTDSG